MTNPDDATIRQILTQTRCVAVVGWSPNPERPSHGVADFLAGVGMRMIPVNPGQAGQAFGGEVIRAGLDELASEGVEMIDVFRQSAAVPEIVTAALAHLPGVKVIWMQLGVVHEEAAARARATGIIVVQDRCPIIEARRLGLA